MSNIDEMRMDKSHFSVASLYDDSDEIAYWQTQTPQARIEALELLRQVFYGYNPTTDRLPRSLEVLKQKRC
jgi:hypothetical protein